MSVSLFRRLYVQVLIGVLAGIALGILAPATAVKTKPLGDAFVALLRILLAPIIFCTVVHGLSNVEDLRRLGRLGTKALIYFELVTTVGLFVGFVLVNVFRPGAGLHVVNPETGALASSSIGNASAAASNFTLVSFLLSIIPTTMVDAFRRAKSSRFCSSLFWSASRSTSPFREIRSS